MARCNPSVAGRVPEHRARPEAVCTTSSTVSSPERSWRSDSRLPRPHLLLVSLTATAEVGTRDSRLLPGILHVPTRSASALRDGQRTHDEEATFDYLENTLFRYEVAPTEVAATS